MYFDSHFALLYAMLVLPSTVFSFPHSAPKTHLSRCRWVLDETPCENREEKKVPSKKEAIIAITMLSFFFESERKICVFKAFLLYNT
jgi:hypothetical protein